MIATDDLTDPAVRRLVPAINDGDLAAFRATPTPGAAMTDDGSERDVAQGTDHEILSADGHLDVESASRDGLAPVARHRDSTWDGTRTSWRLSVTGDGRISRFDTGQA